MSGNRSAPRLTLVRNENERRKTETEPWQPVAGFTWELFCIALVFGVAFGMIPVMLFWMLHGANPSPLLWGAFFGNILLALKAHEWFSNGYRERQRKVVISAQALLTRDKRPHVLYLRPFKDDRTTSRWLNLSTEEQELATVMLEIGPFIAIGEPGERLPGPGAARMYVEDECWQETVEKLMSDARLVVARIGDSKGFWWEVRTARRLVAPERLLLLVPEDKSVYEEFRRTAVGVFPCQLPDYDLRPKSSGGFKTHISTKGFLHFESDWTPHLRGLKSASLRQNFWAPGVPMFKTALRPVYEQLGVVWKRPPPQLIQILPLTVLILSGALTIYVFGLKLLELLKVFREH